jgi:glycosyltransferase involved in cell wall biosynthesis
MGAVMRVLIISFYYPPDLSAGSFRTAALVQALKGLNIPELQIEVLTTQPNRYADAALSAAGEEHNDNLHIRRFLIPSHKSGMKDQARTFASFSRQVWAHTRGKKWDLVFATSSRLMTAMLAALIARRQNTPLYLDIRDLFSDTIGDILQHSRLKYALPIIEQLEKWTFRQASKINVVSEGFVPHIRKIAPRIAYSTFTNGIDPIFLGFDFDKLEARKVTRVVYAGNIGEGQGLHRILPTAVSALKGEVQMRIIGGGGLAHTLKLKLAEQQLCSDNIVVLPPVKREDLLGQYREADILFLHLNDYQAFLKVLPSKIFEYAATGKPIVAGVAGHAADFLRSNVPGVIIFQPCNAEEMVAAVRRAEKMARPVDRDNFCVNYARPVIMQKMALDIVETATRAGCERE